MESNEGHPRRRRLLITAGPTHEPIDSVRFIGNRSSGRLGVELADRAARSGWDVRLLLGPSALTPTDSSVGLVRFRTTAELQSLLDREFPVCDVLVMAAAVADYRPRQSDPAGKIKRQAQGLTLELEATPDLLAGLAKTKRSDQTMVGFALEPRDRMLESAKAKLERKSLDLIVANPLETMDAESIEAVVLFRDRSKTAANSGGGKPETPTEIRELRIGPVPKGAFAAELLNLLEARQRVLR